MTPVNPTDSIRYITNSTGKTTDVIIPVELWKKLIENLEAESGLKWVDENEDKAHILADLQNSLQEAKAGKTLPIEELWANLES
ncbi:MAG: hypothetical protein ACOC0N_11170 [Chroococcales cyanobacterium]